jgi:methenyltetrahydromethanopterin cyclohydrolase
MDEILVRHAIPCVSVNALAGTLVDRMIADSAMLRISPRRGVLGHYLVDAGQTVLGSVEAGTRIAEICMGGLGRVTVSPSEATPPWRWGLTVSSSSPVLACLGSQYAGWSLSHGEGDNAYRVLGSGPGRAIAQKENIFTELGYRDHGGRAIFVLEAPSPPPEALVESIAQDCQLAPKDLVFIYAPTQSIAGTVQIVARVLEVALHKAHELEFPMDRIVDGVATAPLAPPGGDMLTAMGRTNDAIIYGGHAQLFVTGPASDAEDLAVLLPSRASRSYGRPFREIFDSVMGDFYAIDPKLFSPASVTVTAIESGRSFHAGQINPALLDASFS